jgi:hypothetical protein
MQIANDLQKRRRISSRRRTRVKRKVRGTRKSLAMKSVCFSVLASSGKVLPPYRPYVLQTGTFGRATSNVESESGLDGNCEHEHTVWCA